MIELERPTVLKSESIITQVKTTKEKIIDADFWHSSIRHYTSYVLVAGICYIFTHSSVSFINYINNLDLSQSSDAVKNTVIMVSALKSAGLLTALCAFFFRGFPK